MMRRVWSLWALLCLLAPLNASALPNEFIQEGLVVDNDGAPFEGRHRITVRLYEAAQGGAPLLQEDHLNVEFFEGYYAIAVGSQTPGGLDPEIFSRPAVFLSIQIGNGVELGPRVSIGKVPGAFVADVAIDAVGDINPASVSIGGNVVIDANGRWQGDPAGLQGPAGPAGADGAAGPAGPPGPAGGDGSPDTPAQVLAKLLQVHGPGSQLNADLLDGFDAGSFIRTGAQLLAVLRAVDGTGSQVDADRFDGLDSSQFPRTPVQIRDALRDADGSGSGVDADRLDGLDSSAFPRTPIQIRDALLGADGSGSGVDADRLDGLDSTDFMRSNGNITIGGNLAVNGQVTVNQPINGFRLFQGDNPPGPCNAANRGMMYFDTGDNAFLGCDGTEWVGLGGAEPAVPANVSVSGHFGDHRTTPGGWADLPGRSFSFTKASPDSVVRLTYQDVLGYHMVGHSWGCRWRLVMNGSATDRSFSSHTSTARGWRITPTTLEWYL